MPGLTTNISPAGPIIPLAVMISAPRRQAIVASGGQIPPAVKVSGLLDTGASCTCIDPSVIQQLGIPPSGVTSIVTPSTGINPVVCDQFDVSLALLLDKGRLHVIDTLPVIQSNLSRYGHHVLIGRDVLSQGLLFFNGTAGTVTVAF